MPYLVLAPGQLHTHAGVKQKMMNSEATLTECLNVMETQGWDFMFATTGPQSHAPNYYFKKREP